MKREIAPRITVDPGQCGGRPCIRGMRIRVSDVLDLLANGLNIPEVLDELPDLENEDVIACLNFVNGLVQLENVMPETALLSEAALSDWQRPEEEEAWAHLQPVQ